MTKIELVQRINCKDFGEIALMAGDINGDGKIELIIPQSEDGPNNKGSAGGYPHEKTNRCLTALDLQGNILWQRGTPMGFDRHKHHGGPACMVHDLNLDGKDEIVLMTERDHLTYVQLFRGSDGALLAERETGANYNIIPADLRGLGAKRDFVIGTGLSLVFAYDENLEPIWEWAFHYGGGHEHAAVDIEGKGRDDLFIGVSRLDAMGNRIWWRPDLSDSMEGMNRCPHIDHIYVSRLHANNPNYQTLWLGGRDAVCLDAISGQTEWIIQGDHLQEGAIGRFDPASADQQIFMLEKGASGMDRMVDANGKTLWERKIGRCEALPGCGQDGSDLLVCRMPSDDGPPCLINHLGEIVGKFDCPYEPATRPVAKISHLAPRHSDRGYGMHLTIHDVDGDGRPEVLLHDRQWIYIYKVSTQ